MLVSQMVKKRQSGVVEIDRGRQVRAAAQLMVERNVGAVLVRDGGRLSGILSERDIARGVARQGARIAESMVDTLMTADVITCRLSDDSDDLMRVMTEHSIRHLPVQIGDDIVAMVSIRNIVKAHLAELEHESRAMRAYISGAG